MAQENESDFSSKFSTLNVNAMEFVPSFCSPTPPTNTTTTTAAVAAAPVPEPSPSPPLVEAAATTIGTEDSGEEERTMATAATTEIITDKTPENAG